MSITTFFSFPLFYDILSLLGGTHMPRPCKKRRICGIPNAKAFAPCNIESSECINLTLDEYEAIRLVDLEGLTHEECAAQMNISRASVSGICENAHRKLADMLVHGKKLHIDGGHVTVCEQAKSCCGTCGKHKCKMNCTACEKTI